MAKMGGGRAPAKQQAGCSCCQHRQDPADETDSGRNSVEPQPRGPAQPERCGCICLCNGAVETAAVSKVDVGEQMGLAAWLDTSLPAQADADEGFSLRSFGESPPLSHMASGRLIRLALASLLL